MRSPRPLFGGNAETAALTFKQAGFEAGYYWLVSAVMTAGFLVAASMRDTLAAQPHPDLA